MHVLRRFGVAAIGLSCLLLGLVLSSGAVAGQEGEQIAGATAETVGAGITYQGHLESNGQAVDEV